MTIKIKVIKTEEEYKEALKHLEVLMKKDPDSDSEEGEKLELLVALVKDYESVKFPESLPDPIEAILFRMEQQNLKPKDLAPYLGGSSRVSEILSRKRPLTLSMMRALEKGLGIPAKVLLQEQSQMQNNKGVAWERFPLKEMARRKYFGNQVVTSTNLNAVMEDFFHPIASPAQIMGMLRKTYYVRSLSHMDMSSLFAWSAQVVKTAKTIRDIPGYKNNTINLDFMQKLSKLSVASDGPIQAQDFLRKSGVALIIEPHFPQTYLDGATFLKETKNPVIGLTLRHDRLDNFWFTLMHELAHIYLHSSNDVESYYDDLDKLDPENTQESKADDLAGEALVPKGTWENSPAKLIPSPIAAESLARELGVHVAVVAGKMRHEGNNYQYLNKIVNQEKVRKYFKEIEW